jgi:phage terminase large subunit
MEVTLNYKPYTYQNKFHQDESRFRVVAGGRRVGKTKCCLQEALRHCITNENALCWWVAPTYKEAREIGWAEFKEYQEALSPALHSVHNSRLCAEFTNGSKLYFKGSDNPDTLRGRGLTMLVGDEAAFMKDNLWGMVLRPSLSDRHGKAVLISTPNGRNWFHGIYKANSWSSYHWVSSMNPLITPEEIDQVKDEISDVDYRQEYCAEFITRAGRVYSDFSGDNIMTSRINPSDGEWEIFLGMDFGFANPTAVAFMAVNTLTSRVVQFDEIYVERTQLEDIINLIYSKLMIHGLRTKDISYIYTDPAGNSEELTSGISPVDTLRKTPYSFNVVNKGTKVNPGIAQVRAWIKNTKGERRYYVYDTCMETIRSFNGYQYTSSRDGTIVDEPLKDGLHDHMMDAIRYFFVNRFDTAKFVADKPEQEPYTPQVKVKSVVRCGVCHKKYLSSVECPPHVCTQCKEKAEGEINTKRDFMVVTK